MAYLLIVWWLGGGASITVIDSHHHPYSQGSNEAINFARCIQSANSIRKHFRAEHIVKIKCIPQVMKPRVMK